MLRGMRLMRNRRAAILGATVGAVVCAALLAVMALGAGALAPTQQIPPASQTWNVMPIDWPTGGQSNDCALFATDPQTVPAPYQFRIDNPQTLPNGYTTTAPDGTTVNFKLTIATNGPKKDKYFDWTATGANVWDVGVKGGSDTARYSYASPIRGWAGATNGGAPVYADTALHGTLDNQGKLYNLSNVTFCYSTTPSISGTVFDDANGDGIKGTASAEPGIAGRTVRLYSGTAAAVATTTDSAGKYIFAASQLTINASYRVCLVAVSDRSQTLPKSTTPGKAACTTSSNERPLGYGGSTFVHALSGLDFGEARTFSLGGTVFNDTSDDGVKDPGEAGLSGRTVRLYTGATFTASQQTDSTGGYSFPGQAPGSTYKLCLEAATGYAQTLPRSTTSGNTLCTGTSSVVERSYGYGGTATADASSLNFGEVVSNCELSAGSPPNYIIRFTYQCKDTRRFVVQYSDAAGNKFASVKPLDTTQPKVPVVEKIIWTFTGNAQTQNNIRYDDTVPFGQNDVKDLKYCNFDPRLPGGDGMTLDSAYDQFLTGESGLVLPAGGPRVSSPSWRPSTRPRARRRIRRQVTSSCTSTRLSTAGGTSRRPIPRVG